jgi:hypothetical protein
VKQRALTLEESNEVPTVVNQLEALNVLPASERD